MEKKISNSFLSKKYELPSKKIIYLQGYEPFALDILLKEYKEDDIVCNNKKEIPNLFWFDSENKKHIHFVDFYIKSINKCIEIKSTYTFNIATENILLKQKYAKNLGYNYEIWIMSEKGKLINKYD
jgi:hypothetical protein